MKMMQKSLLALAILSTTAMSVQAASSTDLKVIGRIDPGTCTPTLAGGGTVDYGTMSPSVLAATGYTVLSEKNLDFSIACTAPSKVAIKFLNARPGTLAGATEGPSGYGIAPSGVSVIDGPGTSVGGLGTSNNVKVGGYGVRVVTTSLVADSANVSFIRSLNSGSTWGANTIGSALDDQTPRYLSVASTGSTTPLAFTNLSGKLGIQAYLNQKSAFDLTNTVVMDGQSTMELVYLP